MTITPNYGFGQLKPKQKASVRVIISPSRQDIMNNDGCLKFQVVLSTIKHCGALKKVYNLKIYILINKIHIYTTSEKK